MFPLYKNDGTSLVSLTKYQKNRLVILLQEIKNGNLKLIKNDCLCKNKDEQNDIVISEKDRYGIPVSNILCSKCGLIRSEKIFDEESNNIFYKSFYRDLYSSDNKSNNKFFKNQVERGRSFLSLVKQNNILDCINNVVEIGCGAGGILYPFYKNGKECKGFDYNDDYLNIGRKFGLNLILGDWENYLVDNSADLVILSHVMEHFTSPIKQINSIIKKIKLGKYLLVEVPGIFYINKVYLNPLLYLQNAHVFNYYYEYLNKFFTAFGLEVVYGDERCTFLLKKPENWQQKDIQFIYDESLKNYFERIKKYLLETDNNYKKQKYLNFYYWRNIFSGILSKIGLKEMVKRVFKF